MIRFETCYLDPTQGPDGPTGPEGPTGTPGNNVRKISIVLC